MFLRALKILADSTDKKIRAFIIGDGEERAAIEQMARDLGLRFNNEDLKESNILTFTSWIRRCGCIQRRLRHHSPYFIQ
jgi:hypothetical protein